MPRADKRTYLAPLLDEMSRKWPDNRTVNIVCHGHSVPSGYFATPQVNTFAAYPHLLHRIIKERFPFAVVNVIVTAIGGESSLGGAKRFAEDVLTHKPDVVTIDYALNDRSSDTELVRENWKSMIRQALDKNVKVILLTPTWDNSYFDRNDKWDKLVECAETVRSLADEYGVGLSDSFDAFKGYVKKDYMLTDLLSHVNHPSQLGHELAARELGGFFLAR